MTMPNPLLDAPRAPPGAAVAGAGYKIAVAVLLAAAQSLAYFAIGRADLTRSSQLLHTRLDDAIPFLPWTAWCYLPFYAAIFVMAIGGFRRRALFDRAARSVVILMLIGGAGHLLIRAEYPRPLLSPPYHDLSHAFLAAVQRIDPPGNVFPSLHVAHSSMLALLLIRDRPLLGRVAAVMALFLALSTLTTKQHFVVDVLAGYLLAFMGRAVALHGGTPETTGAAGRAPPG
jgi:membrane-associated phospholipid phosphatase